MASNSYYQGGSQQPPYGAPQHSSPYYQNHDTPSPQPTPAPPYEQDSYNPNYAPDTSIYPADSATHIVPTKQTPYSPNDVQYQPSTAYGSPSGQHNQPGQTGQTGQSPFDTVFDDHVYPANPNARQTPGSSTADIGQQGFYQDTSYHGGATDAAGRPYGQEDIPLQDRTPKNDDVEMNDHVYDAPGRPKKKSKKDKVRLGELGMIGSDKKRIPWVVYLFSVIQVAVFIAEVARMGVLTGTPIAIKPQFNVFIGPSPGLLINMGARYAPCMRNVKGIQSVDKNKDGAIIPGLLCPNATKADSFCPLHVVCGFGGDVPDPKFNGDINQSPEPNQWYRFITSIFMHAGIIHIVFNLLLQLTIAKEMEMAIGPVRFLLVYMSAGIFGNIMGGNYAPPGQPSVGASGALFGIIALVLLDLLYSWKDRRSPVKDLLFIVLDMVIAFVLGLLPGLDNFVHIGGFLMGLSLGVCVLHSPNSLRRRMGDGLSYAAVSPQTGETPPHFFKNPVGFFKGRKPLWWAWWLVRAAFLVMIIVVFIVLLNNFYKYHDTCEWCKYLNCLPINDWCEWGSFENLKPA
ncbi:unnamed protein product [Fusarium graminearum]|uniref:Rhomboid-type serine protease n=2 Tax=Gibberella zeae TaxID=5518 RepID=I1S8A6_GIBZE|nr:hypothetical protein FGSG_13084 [Fusarium graminearum PH-1]EYB26642.1 hypothetical protein FG05_13084 [Fusarium graminearum]ESU13390.1 hypothetical protein FGSG_13084 [Fusarium graminearum PH-1]KAI6754976.1 hypothetical protein HG531_004082 [Fusarium graminearum]PCD40587.1 hypothetical protein FGRA07_01858 [Fusarium graminearum]CAF3443722.1 unnamed protein product [Fusarium graminearum]|eukprot:XP_011326897.1 hypothetical protein FGSG_13084 [Fusarium graminearum PH-1]